jgi:hypothetical protein
MRYVTIAMLIKHTGKCRRTIERGLAVAGVKGERFPGVLGKRIREVDAQKVLTKHWPETGPINLP